MKRIASILVGLSLLGLWPATAGAQQPTANFDALWTLEYVMPVDDGWDHGYGLQFQARAWWGWFGIAGAVGLGQWDIDSGEEDVFIDEAQLRADITHDVNVDTEAINEELAAETMGAMDGFVPQIPPITDVVINDLSVSSCTDLFNR